MLRPDSAEREIHRRVAEAPAAPRALGWIYQIELTLTFGQREAISASMKSRTSRDFGRSVGMIR